MPAGPLKAALLLLPVATVAAQLSPHARRQLDDRIKAGPPPFSSLMRPAPPPARLTWSPRCVLEAVARRKRRTLDPSKPIPPVLYESETPLARFQDAVQEQWGQRPEIFSNAYSLKTGEIFLIDEAGYYERLRRVIDDSLAHELAHYVQVVYENADLVNDPTGSYEADAVDVQTWFRDEVFTKSPPPGC